MFQHFIITRFNVKHNEWKVTKNNEQVLTDAWLLERFKLFNEYCFPSIINQSNKNFIWLVFFDTNTPSSYIKYIKKIEERCKNFIPIFIDSEKHLESTIKKEIKKNIGLSDSHIITTRLDNDDCLHKDFVVEVQSVFNFQDFCVVDVLNGLILNIGSSNKLATVEKHFNPFISLIEKSNNPETILSKKHYSWHDTKDIIKIRKKPLWLQIIHDTNLVNVFSFNYLVHDFNGLSEFGIDPNIYSKFTIQNKMKLIVINTEQFLKINIKKGLITVRKIKNRWL